jgi:predicted ATP-dependent endonuclease of OLD family
LRKEEAALQLGVQLLATAHSATSAALTPLQTMVSFVRQGRRMRIVVTVGSATCSFVAALGG